MGPMLERSGSGPYSGLANSLASLTKPSFEKGGASDPKVITDLVIKAVRARNPNTRYAAGKYAKPMLFVHKWLCLW